MSHKVTIELEFEPASGESDEEQTVFESDVYNYLEQLIKDGFDYYITKPIDKSFISQLKEILGTD